MSRSEIIRLIRANRDGAQLNETMNKVAGTAYRAGRQAWGALGTAGERAAGGLAGMGVENKAALTAARFAPKVGAGVAAHETFYGDTADKMRQSVHNFRMKRLMKNRQRQAMAQQMAQMGGGR